MNPLLSSSVPATFPSSSTTALFNNAPDSETHSTSNTDPSSSTNDAAQSAEGVPIEAEATAIDRAIDISSDTTGDEDEIIDVVGDWSTTSIMHADKAKAKSQAVRHGSAESSQAPLSAPLSAPLIKQIRPLNYEDLRNTQRIINDVDEPPLLDQPECLSRAQSIVERCIQKIPDAKKLPTKQALIALINGAISEETFCEWSEATIESFYQDEIKESQKRIAYALFNTLQRKLPCPLAQVLMQSKLSTAQCQTWIQDIRKNAEKSNGPFTFYRKIENFLLGAAQLEDPLPPEEAHARYAHHIITALQEGRLSQSQLDKWLRNPAYDVSLIARFSEKIKHALQPDQIALLEKLVIQEHKIDLATQLRESWLILQAEEKNPTGINIENIRHKIHAIEKYLMAIEENLENKKALVLKHIDVFIANQADEWLTLQKNANILFPQFASLTPEEVEQFTPLSLSVWPQKFLYKALFMLMDIGISFNSAKEILVQKNHQRPLQQDPMMYLRHLSSITYQGAKPEVIKNFSFNSSEAPENSLLLAALDNAHGHNALRNALEQQQILWPLLRALSLELLDRLQTTRPQSNQSQYDNAPQLLDPRKNYLHAIQVLRKIVPEMGVTKVLDAIRFSTALKNISALSQYSHDPDTLCAVVELEERLGTVLYSWLRSIHVDKELLSLPCAMQSAFNLDLDLWQLSKQLLLLPQYRGAQKYFLAEAQTLCVLFGTRIGEFGNAIQQAITQELIQAEDLKKHFLLTSGLFYNSKHVKQFCTYVLPRILKKEITFNDFIDSLEPLQKSIRKLPEPPLAWRYRNTFIRLHCQGEKLQELQAFLTQPLIKIFDTLNFFLDPLLPFFLKERTITLEKLWEWLKSKPPIPPEQITFFIRALIHVHAGTLDLETLESWMRKDAFSPDTRQGQTRAKALEKCYFDPVVAENLQQQTDVKTSSMSEKDIQLSWEKYESLFRKIRLQEVAEEIDQHNTNTLLISSLIPSNSI